MSNDLMRFSVAMPEELLVRFDLGNSESELYG